MNALLDLFKAKNVLLVHFAGAEGGEPEHKRYPKNLQHLRDHRCDICCCTVSPSKLSPWGTCGLIILPSSIACLKGVSDHDMGSCRSEDCLIEVPSEFRDVTIQKCEETIDTKSDMNEWVVSGNYHVAGLFIADTVAHRLQPGDIATLQGQFPGLKIFTSNTDTFSRIENIWLPISAADVYQTGI